MKKPNLNQIVLSLFISFSLLSCHENCLTGQGEIQNQSMAIGTFSSVKLKIPANLYLEQNAGDQVKIEAQANVAQQLSFQISDDVLTIDSKACLGENKGINLYLKSPVINKLTIEGSGNINGQGFYHTEQLEMAIRGSGNINVKTNAEVVFAGIKGSGNIVIAGSAQKQYVRIDGSGNYNASILPTVKSDVYINGSGSASVHTLETLFANINGSGDIKYKGSPKVTSKIAGSGQLVRVDP